MRSCSLQRCAESATCDARARWGRGLGEVPPQTRCSRARRVHASPPAPVAAPWRHGRALGSSDPLMGRLATAGKRLARALSRPPRAAARSAPHFPRSRACPQANPRQAFNAWMAKHGKPYAQSNDLQVGTAQPQSVTRPAARARAPPPRCPCCGRSCGRAGDFAVRFRAAPLGAPSQWHVPCPRCLIWRRRHLVLLLRPLPTRWLTPHARRPAGRRVPLPQLAGQPRVCAAVQRQAAGPLGACRISCQIALPLEIQAGAGRSRARVWTTVAPWSPRPRATCALARPRASSPASLCRVTPPFAAAGGPQRAG